MDPLVRSVAAALARAGLANDAHVAVACSGGTDSVVLAHAAAGLLRAETIGRLTLLHVDHGLRPGSADDGAVVAALAAGLGASVRLERVEVDRAQASLEDAARRARYAALDRAADELGADAVLLAHTRDDQAETVLLRVLRGTGIDGLGAMASRRGRYLRPLLGTSRADVAAYRARHLLGAIDDPMNLDRRFARVRARLDLLPALAAENPRIAEALARLADRAGEAREALAFAARSLARDAALPDGSLSAQRLQAAPAGLSRRVLTEAAARAGVGALAAVHLDAVATLVDRPAAGSRRVDVPGGIALREYDRVRFVPSGEAGCTPAALEVRGGDGGPYATRTWQPGDRMRPARLRGRSRKLSDLYTDLRVPRALRSTARVVLDAAGVIVWAEHVGPAWKSDAQVSLTGVDPVASNKN